MQLKNAELIDCGIDWFTSTFSDRNNGEIALQKASILVQSEHLQGDDKRLWSGFGYEGFCAGGVRVGTRTDTVLVQLSGPAAQQHWHKFLPLASNVSRLDLQVTNRYECNSSTVLAKHFKAATRAHKKGSSKRRVTLLRSSDESATLYLGSRSSERFGRIYQKDRESRLEHYQNAVRYELELKGESAWSTARQVASSFSVPHMCASLVKNWFGVSQCHFPIPEHDGTSFIRCSRSRRDTYSRLEWLATDVRPAVELLLARGFRSEIMKALNIPEQSQETTC